MPRGMTKKSDLQTKKHFFWDFWLYKQKKYYTFAVGCIYT